jgi:zinc protease
VVIVGDFTDSDSVEKIVKTEFSGMTARAPAQPDPSYGDLPKFDGMRAIFHAEPEASSVNISFTSITPYTRELDTSARELKRLPRSIALAMLNRRFSILAKKENSPFVSADASVSENFNFYRDASINVTCKPEQWQAALSVGEQELRRALEHGFTDEELKEEVASELNELEQAVKTESTRLSYGHTGLATQIAESVVDGDVFTSPETDLALLKPALEKMTPKDCLDALSAAFAAKGRYVMVSGNVQIPGDAEAAIAATYKQSQAVAVAAPAVEKEVAWGYTDFGAPGKVVNRKHIDDLDIDLVTFANGVRLNIKKTTFEAGHINLNARIGYGTITQPSGERGLAALAGATFDAGGLGKHSVDELQRIFAGKNVSMEFHVGADAFTFSGGTTPDDLPLEMQILAAKITDPGYRPEALRAADKNFEQLYLSFEHTSDGPMATEVANLLASGDPRIGLPPKDVMMSRTLDEEKAWLTPQLANGPLEVAVVGDLDVEATIAAAAKTIGALPAREARADLGDLEKVSFPAKPFVKQYIIDSQIPKCELALYWPTTDGFDIQRRRRLSVLGEVFSDLLRVKVREKIGGTYSPAAASNASETFPGYGYLAANIDVDPARAAAISDLAVTVADDLATKGMTEDELARVRLPLLTALKDSLRSNAYWLGSVLARAQEKPEMLDWARNRIDDINSITIAELDALAKQYLVRDHVSRVTILPSASPSADPEKK